MTLAALAVCCLVHPLLAAPHGGETRSATVIHGGRTLRSDRLPADFPALAGQALSLWAPWAAEVEFRIEVGPDGETLLLVHEARASTKREWEELAELNGWFDHRLPCFEAPTTPAPANAGIPGAPEEEEDLEPWDDAPTGGPSSKSKAAPVVGMPRLPHRAAVFIELRDERDMARLAPYLGSTSAYLREWSEKELSAMTGFALQEPLVAAWMVSGSGLEEYNPLNEFVHRAAELRLLDKFGQVPYWLHSGIAWAAELAVCGSVYCFPYRDEFIGVGEHGGWKPQLASLFKPKDSAPSWKSVAALQRGGYRDTAAAMAWGMAEFLLAQSGVGPSQVLLELDCIWRQEGITVERRADGGHSWRTIKGYEVPLERQRAVFEQHLGGDLLQRFAAHWREKGK
jgi:hypothetical protein